jgi:hypothetical protein
MIIKCIGPSADDLLQCGAARFGPDRPGDLAVAFANDVDRPHAAAQIVRNRSLRTAYGAHGSEHEAGVQDGVCARKMNRERGFSAKVVLTTRLRDTTDKEQASLERNMRISVPGSCVLTDDLRMLFGAGTSAGSTDAQLLKQVAANRDAGAQAAFAALVARHGPMVWRVCGTTLRDLTDIEDAFQATFLVLARKARSIREPDSVKRPRRRSRA